MPGRLASLELKLERVKRDGLDLKSCEFRQRSHPGFRKIMEMAWRIKLRPVSAVITPGKLTDHRNSHEHLPTLRKQPDDVSKGPARVIDVLE